MYMQQSYLLSVMCKLHIRHSLFLQILIKLNCIQKHLTYEYNNNSYGIVCSIRIICADEHTTQRVNVTHCLNYTLRYGTVHLPRTYVYLRLHKTLYVS